MEIETERKGAVLIAKTVERVDGVNARESTTPCRP